jgi:hypothetical protein
MGTWALAIATIILALAAIWQAIETRRSIKKDVAAQILTALQDSQNSTVRAWARGQLATRLKDVGVSEPPGPWFIP